MSLHTPPENFAGYTSFVPHSIESWRTFDDGSRLDTLIYKPEDWAEGDRRNAMVFFFGGGWRQGSPWQFAPYAAHLAQQGWVVVLPEYRVRSTHGTTPVDATLDARAIMRWVAGNAARLGIDATRIYAGGGSAGGHLAAALPVAHAIDRDEDAANTPTPRALVLFNPAVHFAHPQGLASNRNLTQALGISLEEFLTVDPHPLATADYPPALILHGAADQVIDIAAVRHRYDAGLLTEYASCS